MAVLDDRRVPRRVDDGDGQAVLAYLGLCDTMPVAAAVSDVLTGGNPEVPEPARTLEDRLAGGRKGVRQVDACQARADMDLANDQEDSPVCCA